MSLDRVNNFILNQFEKSSTKEEIQKLSINDIDFIGRTRVAIDLIVPKLCSISVDLKNKLNCVYNEHVNHCMSLNKNEEYLYSVLYTPSSDKVSSMIQAYLSNFTDIRFYSNGANSYPDMYLSSFDYTALPKGSKELTNDQVNAPYLTRYKNPSSTNPPRPNKVPDGLEVKSVQVKTYKEKFSALSHAPHVGLHLGCKWIYKNKKYEVLDILLGFLSKESYRTYDIKTEADTRKCFLEEKHFISLLD